MTYHNSALSFTFLLNFQRSDGPDTGIFDGPKVSIDKSDSMPHAPDGTPYKVSLHLDHITATPRPTPASTLVA